MGAWAAEIYQEHGAIVQAVSDAFGAVYNESGLDIKALRAHLAEGNSLDTFPDGKDSKDPLSVIDVVFMAKPEIWF